jgi:DHA3 family macrolide efflux protein-like MFS transporter
MGAAGLIIAVTGISGAIFVDGATFFISCLIIAFIKIKGDTTSTGKLTIANYLEGLKSGFSFLRRETIILTTVILAAFANFCFTPFIVLKPAYVNDILGSGPEVLGILGVVTTIGIIIGGLVVGQFGTRFKNSQLIIFGLFSIGIVYALFSIPGSIKALGISPVVMAAIISFIFSFFIPVTFSPINAYILQNTPQQFLGRVSSFMGIITLSSVPVASWLSGIITEYIPITMLFIILGTLIVITAFSLIFNKEFCNS